MELLYVNEGYEELAKKVRLAKELGHREVLLLFTRHEQKNGEISKRLKEGAPRGLLLTTGIVVEDRNQAGQLRRQYEAVVAPCRRELLECRAVTHILDPEKSSRPDFLHHRNSGMNQVLLKFCTADTKRQSKTILSSFSQLLVARRPEIVLGRMMQNARWCRKYDVCYELVSGARTIWEQRAASDLAAARRELTNKN